VRSLPDGIGQVLEEYLQIRETDMENLTYTHLNGNGGVPEEEVHKTSEAELPLMRVGDLCPECGQAAVINEEGCRKCYACGYSEC
jgi:ribonucleoside-diphosphate reductase alpha chain